MDYQQNSPKLNILNSSHLITYSNVKETEVQRGVRLPHIPQKSNDKVSFLSCLFSVP